MPGQIAYPMASVFSMQDDAIPALRALSHQNHILLLTPTTPQTHQYNYMPLVQRIVKLYNKSVLCMDYTPPPNNNRYLPFDDRHERALTDETCAAVIVVVRGDDAEGGRGRRGTSMDFARRVWEECGEGEEMPGVLVEIGGSRRAIGNWQTILYVDRMEAQEDIADLIFGC